MKGTIISYDHTKGYGLILGEDDKEVFVYEKDIDFFTLLNKGDVIEYDVVKSDSGLKAVNVKIIKDSLFRS